ncbi:MAG TPA: SDR family oxidoreductase [Candidatus Binatia bacterium]|nr:SDR family oxidoreductase [Candidatus Binatia bacterium]
MATLALENKSIVIVGGTSGLGLSAARAFLAAGARVVIVGRDPAKVEAAERDLGRNVIGLAADATDPKAAPAAINIALGNFNAFHGLYHVAGGSGRRQGDGPLHELTDEGWQYTLTENLTTLAYSNRAAVQQFLRQQSGGSILNMSSVLGFSPSPRFFSTQAYAAAKAAVIGLTRSAAAYYAPAGIRFNVLAPALVATPMSQRAQEDPEILGFIATKQPLDGGRIGHASDLDGAAVFFMSDDAKFVTGQVLAVDGGWSVSEGHLAERVSAPGPAPQPEGLFRTLGKLWGRLTKGGANK